MDMRRVFLYAALALVSFSLWTEWSKEHPPVPVTSSINQQQTAVNLNDQNALLPQHVVQSGTAQSNTGAVIANQPTLSTSAVQVKTNVLNLTIDLAQGDITNADLLAYPLSVNEKNTPFPLLYRQQGTADNKSYVANSSLFVHNGQNIENLNLNYTSAQNSYVLGADQSEMVVVLSGQTNDGLRVEKQFKLTKDSYLIDVSYVIHNESAAPWTGYMNMQLMHSTPQEDKSSIFHVGSYTGASYSIPNVHRYQKVPFKDMTKSNLEVESKNGGWIAMQQHYFLTAWVPSPTQNNSFYTRVFNGDYAIGAVSQPLTIAPGSQQQLGARLYLGPENTEVLKAISPGLEMTVDYGWLWFVSSLLFSLMKAIYSFVGNWGWSIVLVTVLIKLAFYKLSATSYKSMANMRKLQPKLLALRERYGDDKAKMSQATMELYRQEKVNPLGGCLPILIQIPVFIALYWVLIESVELRQAPFIFWIKDLAEADPYHVLPIIMGITMLIQQRLNPAPPDPMQAKVMMFLPILFTALFWSFPSGLVLYWIVNNTLSIAQQWYITRKYADDKPVVKTKAITAK